MYLKVCPVNFRFNRMKRSDRVFRLDAVRDTGGQGGGTCKECCWKLQIRRGNAVYVQCGARNLRNLGVHDIIEDNTFKRIDGDDIRNTRGMCSTVLRFGTRG